MGVDLTKLQYQTKGLAAAIRWHVSRFLCKRLWLMNLFCARFTVFDAFNAPGDTLLAAIVCRHIKQKFPRIRLNMLTRNPELVARDPNPDEINAPESYICHWQWYLDHVEARTLTSNILEPAFERLGIRGGEYRARVFLSAEEIEAGAALVPQGGLPVIAFNTKSKEVVKNWPLESWIALIEKLRGSFEFVHLGDDREPHIPGVRRLAGRLGLRESMAVLAGAQLFAGPDSFLMHAANGLDIPSVIIFGGSRSPQNLGYADNTNLFVKMACGPCWIHEIRGEHCQHDIACMKKITVDEVYDSIMRLAHGHALVSRE